MEGHNFLVGNGMLSVLLLMEFWKSGDVIHSLCWQNM